ncbi:MAG: hypothetical protein AABZ10_06095 [Nitrospirota bacterium]
MFTKTRNTVGLVLVFTMILVGLAAVPAQAALDPVTLTSNLTSLVTQGNNLIATMSKTTLTATAMNTQLAQLETAVVSYQTNVMDVYNTVAAAVGTGTFSVTSDILVALQNLATINASLGSGLLSLSQSIVNLAPSTAITTLQSSLAAMLRLSDDIGVMADRILEMADKILVMADNIGIMADRILATQVIQSTNLKLIVDVILQTQQNTILLITAFKL